MASEAPPPSPVHWTVKYYKAAWVVVFLLAAALIGGALTYINGENRKAAAAQQEQQKKADKAKAEAQRKKKQEEARRAAELKRRQQEEAARKAAEAEADMADDDSEPEPEPDPTPDPEPDPEVTDEEVDTDSDEEADEKDEQPGKLKLKEPNEADSKRFAALLKQCERSQDFATLRDTLKAAINEAYPELLATDEAETPSEGEATEASAALLPNLPRKAATVTKAAICVYLCLDIALRHPAEDTKLQAAFCSWLLTNKAKASTTFVRGLVKNKISSATDAADMLCELRDFYAAEPKKAQAEIKRITSPIGNKVNKKLYPVTDTKEIDSQVAKILKNKSRGTPADQQDAVNRLNVYRYLCGVEPGVTYDKDFAEQAGKAAAACRKNGGLSHELGEFTDVCNLHSGGFSKMSDTVADYMRDAGDNNREKRGHRMWCLHPQLGKTGFGQAESFHAMRVTDISAKNPVQTAYSYPGRGYFPAAYLDGDGWSYYAPSGVDLGSEITVEMWRLGNSLKAKPEANKLGRSNAVPIKAVFPNGSFVVFEPDYGKMKMKKGKLFGTYWIRIKAGKFTDEYVVDIY